MSIKFSHIYTKGDKIKMAILLVVTIIAWVVVWHEYKKPINIDWDTSIPHTTNIIE